MLCKFCPLATETYCPRQSWEMPRKFNFSFKSHFKIWSYECWMMWRRRWRWWWCVSRQQLRMIKCTSAAMFELLSGSSIKSDFQIRCCKSGMWLKSAANVTEHTPTKFRLSKSLMFITWIMKIVQSTSSLG